MKRLRVAIIGAGLWGGTHAAIYQEHSDLVAICDSNLSRAEALAEKYHIPNAYASVDDMLGAGGFDAVSIVTPDHLHADVAVKCAEAKKHMLIEKPLATTREDVFRIVNAAKRNGVRVMVDMHNRWNPPFVEAHRLVRLGQLGTLRSAYLRLNDIKQIATGMLSWAANSSILWFLGSHSLDLLQWLFQDEVSRVYTVSNRGVLDSLGVPVDDTFQTTLEFRSGGAAQMENSWIEPNAYLRANDIKCSLCGSKAMISIDASSHNLIQLYSDQKASVPDILARNEIHGHVKGFAYESIRDFVDSLLTDRPFVVSLEEGARASLAILAIIESARTHKPVRVDYGDLNETVRPN